MMQWSSEARLRAAISFICAGLALAEVGCAAKHAALPISDLGETCASWTPSTGHSNAGSTGLGCVNALNLKNMVADPRDLRVGKALGPADGAREALAVEAYKQGKVKDLKPSGGSGSVTLPVGGMK